ncbi:hypothetical protein VTJ83DRAFT_399 [Remersonia thermophila]|uniref:Palmitoyltransferase PFA4 n=1 Tax=Remersonia thermophila TaxID=72144 RepID=A0ABR4DKY7_9PEZI
MPSIQTGPAARGLHFVYIPAVCTLIAFLGYFSQYLFGSDPNIAPGPLSRRQSLTFNALLLCLWWCYYRACTVDPGRYVFPSSQQLSPPSSSPNAPLSSGSSSSGPTTTTTTTTTTTRWCKKCSRPKPLRAHHCRHCARCIPKMDHHCPWTGNCVSMQSFPDFLRFLVYANLALAYLASLLWPRLAFVWSDRHLPAYLGPSVGSLAGLAVLALAHLVTSLALLIMLVTTVRSWVTNCTMIEAWEMERHEAAAARAESAGYDGNRHDDDNNNNNNGDDDGPFWADDAAVLRARLARVEFPYDIGFFANMAQAMGTRNPLRWFLPVFGGHPVVDNARPGVGAGWRWDENGFNDLPGMWPPPDPEKMRREALQQRRQQRQSLNGRDGGAGGEGEGGFLVDYDAYRTPEELKAAFAKRQHEDWQRRQRLREMVRTQHGGGGIAAELEEMDAREAGRRRAPWTNSDGDRLWDYGVDEDVEEDRPASPPPVRGSDPDDDDEIPLGELIRRRKATRKDHDDED